MPKHTDLNQRLHDALEGMLAGNGIVPKFPLDIAIKVEWPSSVKHDGLVYYDFQKDGYRATDGLPSHCYQASGQRRLSLGLDGKITDD